MLCLMFVFAGLRMFLYRASKESGEKWDDDLENVRYFCSFNWFPYGIIAFSSQFIDMTKTSQSCF